MVTLSDTFVYYCLCLLAFSGLALALMKNFDRLKTAINVLVLDHLSDTDMLYGNAWLHEFKNASGNGDCDSFFFSIS